MKKITLPLILASTILTPNYSSAVENQKAIEQKVESLSLEEVTVQVIQRKNGFITRASGTIIGPEKDDKSYLVLTNQHAVELMGSYDGVTINYKNQNYTGTVVAHEYDDNTDLALVSFNPLTKVTYANVAKNDISIGESVVKCGYKHGRAYNQVHTKVIDAGVEDGLITEVDSINGESGGGLFSFLQSKDKNPKLVGVCYGGGSKELGFHAAYIPGKTVRTFLYKNKKDHVIEQ